MSNERGGRYVVISKKQTGSAERVRYNTSGGIALSSGAQVRMQGADGGVRFGANEPPTRATANIIRGYWTDTQDRPITEALVGDDVRFHIETRGVRNGEPLWYRLFDDDRLLVEGEDGEDDHIQLVDRATNRPRLFQPVTNNKVVIAVTLSNLEGAVRAEEDRMLELYYRVSCEGQNTDLPTSTDQYLRVLALPFYIDRYKIPGLNETGDEIANDMAYGYGAQRAGSVYAGTPELAAYKAAYQGDGFNPTRDALFSNAQDFPAIPAVPPTPTPDQPAVPQDNTRVERPNIVDVGNARINALNRSRKAVYDREEMYRAAYRIPIPGTNRHIPVSTGLDIRVFDNFSDEQLFWNFEQTASLYFARGELQANLSRLIAKFRRNEGGVYEDAAMTAAANANERTATFCQGVEDEIAERIKTNAGKISKVKDDRIYFSRRDRPAKYATMAYNNDKTGGLTIATNDIWAHEVSLIEYRRTGDDYTAKYEIVLWDHFGLDLPDMEKLFNIIPSAGEAFVTWFILQHLRGYKPFITKIRIERTFEGNISMGGTDRTRARAAERAAQQRRDEELRRIGRRRPGEY